MTLTGIAVVPAAPALIPAVAAGAAGEFAATRSIGPSGPGSTSASANPWTSPAKPTWCSSHAATVTAVAATGSPAQMRAPSGTRRSTPKPSTVPLSPGP